MRMDDGELRDLDESCVKQRLGMSDSVIGGDVDDGRRAFQFDAIPGLDASEHAPPVLNDNAGMMPVHSEMVSD